MSVPSPTVSPETMKRLKSQLARKSISRLVPPQSRAPLLPPRQGESSYEAADRTSFGLDLATSAQQARVQNPELDSAPRCSVSDFAVPEISREPILPVFPSNLPARAVPLRPSSSRPPPTPPPRTFPDHPRSLARKPSWATEREDLIRRETREREELENRLGLSEPHERVAATEVELPAQPERMILEGTLLVPPSNFTSLSEIGKLSRPYWIPYHAILTTKSLSFVLPSMLETPPSTTRTILEFDRCTSIDKPIELRDREGLFTFQVEMSEERGKKYFATEAATDWVTWTTAIRACIELANGRAPPTLETVLDSPSSSDNLDYDERRLSTSARRVDRHLAKLKEISDRLEYNLAEAQQTRGSQFKEMLSSEGSGVLGQSQGWRWRDERRKEENGVASQVDTQDKDERLRDQYESVPRLATAQNPQELLNTLKEHELRFEENRRYGEDQSKALASFVKDLHSSQKLAYDRLPTTLDHALTTIKEAEQVQTTVEEFIKSKKLVPRRQMKSTAQPQPDRDVPDRVTGGNKDRVRTRDSAGNMERNV
ncbi:uncharacterized protein JCM6883_003078 [Sporobolomyces salmoneus]|uniref:uncharacterized protein n=1 Tax=Sporobolomyces salmoneus TaxID=183962 RepID=UPI00317DDC79